MFDTALVLAVSTLITAAIGVQCQGEQWQFSGDARLVSVTTEDLSELADSNDTLIEYSQPGVLGAHGRKILQSGCGTTYSYTISIAAQSMSVLGFNNMNNVGFDISQTVRIIAARNSGVPCLPNGF